MRLLIGLTQGLLGAALAASEQRFAQAPEIYGALLLTCAYLPILLLSAVADLRLRSVFAWSVLATMFLAAVGVQSVLRQAPPDGVRPPFAPTFDAWILAAAALYIAHHLIVPADQTRRWRAPYAAYFETGWKHAVQIGLALLFTGVAWLVLWLGAELFRLINIEAVRELITDRWFAYPATTTLFAAGVHLTDVRAALTRGVRNVVAFLLSWLGPALTAIVAAFLSAVLFTGLEPLWRTRAAAAVLLSAAAGLIILLNAAHQDGEDPPAVALRWSGRVSAGLLPILVSLTAYGLALRIDQYGLTPGRVIAATGVLVGVVYAAGYGASALRRRGPWMKGIETTNVVAALLIVGLIAALTTPIADPARLSVADQTRRLEQRVVSPDRFDWHFLCNEGGRYGADALGRLASRTGSTRDSDIARRAAEAQSCPTAYVLRAPAQPEARTARLQVFPPGATLPEDFASQDWGEIAPMCLTGRQQCEAYQIDLDGDGRVEILLASDHDVEVFSRGPARWDQVGRIGPWPCPPVREALLRGDAAVQAPRWRELEAGGVRVTMTPSQSCGDDAYGAVVVTIPPPPPPPATPRPR